VVNDSGSGSEIRFQGIWASFILSAISQCAEPRNNRLIRKSNAISRENFNWRLCQPVYLSANSIS